MYQKLCLLNFRLRLRDESWREPDKSLAIAQQLTHVSTIILHFVLVNECLRYQQLITLQSCHRKLITTLLPISLLTTKCKVKYHIKLLSLNQVYALCICTYIHIYNCALWLGCEAVHFHRFNGTQAAVYQSCQINTRALPQKHIKVVKERVWQGGEV